VAALVAEPAHCMSERGSAPVDTIFSILFLMLLVFGTIEVALALYGRDVVAAAAHEGARAALELDRYPAAASQVARQTVRRSSGALVRDLTVQVIPRTVGTTSNVRVHVAGWLRLAGPVPVPVPVSATATVSREIAPR
jgi:Flp pilus assembly protein TadG